MSQKADFMEGDGKGGVGHMWVRSPQTRTSRGWTWVRLPPPPPAFAKASAGKPEYWRRLAFSFQVFLFITYPYKFCTL